MLAQTGPVELILAEREGTVEPGRELPRVRIPGGDVECRSVPLRDEEEEGAGAGSDLFTWSRDAELLSTPAVRAITRRTGVSPALALVLAELAGLSREARHG
jgi:hypothetical protein